MISKATVVLGIRQAETATHDCISFTHITALLVGAYFALSVLYYIRPLPLGHIFNLSFGIVFLLLAIERGQRKRFSITAVLVFAGFIVLSVCSVVGLLLRDEIGASALARSLTWLTPGALLLCIVDRESLNHAVICKAAGSIGLVANIAITILFAEFNPSIAKFEVNTAWIEISSNELSFHLVAFCFLFLALGTQGRIGYSPVFAFTISLIHLSKAHIAALIGGCLLAMLRRRLWLTILIFASLMASLYMIAISDILSNIDVPTSVNRVFRPFLDALVMGSRLIFIGAQLDLSDLSNTVGFYRFQVYDGAFFLISQSAVGYSQSVIDMTLRGLDPHSNVLYLALREGWFVTIGYLISIVVGMATVPRETLTSRIVFGTLAYILIRSLFLTFDPVKLAALAVYANVAVRHARAHAFT